MFSLSFPPFFLFSIPLAPKDKGIYIIIQYQEKFNPDRRDNLLLNASIRSLLDNLDEASNDAVLGYAEQSAETISNSDYAQKKSRLIAHEIRNQLSICDLYSEIITRQADSNDIEGIKNSIKSINKAIRIANNSLLNLKSKETSKLNEISLKEVIDTSVELSQVYLIEKNIEAYLHGFNFTKEEAKCL